MAIVKKTLIICYDDHRMFTGDIRKRFADTSQYKVISFPDKEEFIKNLQQEKYSKYCKIAIIGIHNGSEKHDKIKHLTEEIKTIYPDTGLIFIGPPDKKEEVKKIVKFRIDAYIPGNTNAVLRTHNTVKSIISEHNISIYRKRRNISVAILFLFLLLSSILIVISYFRYPAYF